MVAMKKCRKQSEAETKLDCFALLSDDLLLEILRKVPAAFLRYKLKHVCRRWFNIISNRILLDHASLILQQPGRIYKPRLVDITEEEEGLKMKEQYVDLPSRVRIKSWCNEFLLITDANKRGSLYVYNLITKEGSYLPQCTTSCGGHFTCKCGVGLSFDGINGVYKVVHVFMGPPVYCEILVLKGDIITCHCPKWKKINTHSDMGQMQYYWGKPVSVQGRYFHWDVHGSNYLVSLDSVKERFRQTPLPDDCPMGVRHTCVEMGGFLTLVHQVSWNQAGIWILKDFQGMKWEKLQSISASIYLDSGISPGVCVPFPVIGVRSRRYLIFRNLYSEAALFSYDLKTKLMKKLDIRIASGEWCVSHSTAPSF